ncbi:helix-turn-helix domain-containing protein [Leisingera sp. ANG-M1]|uniref:helix-turn-helix domain-containing protein n=1 Tax=Leisingera sp. ANG-M1 TaxID=1577895 RepID=UPI0009E40AB7
MTGNGLALSAGIDRSYISEIELAKSSVSPDISERLTRALNVDPQTLLAPRGNRERK